MIRQWPGRPARNFWQCNVICMLCAKLTWSRGRKSDMQKLDFGLRGISSGSAYCLKVAVVRLPINFDISDIYNV